MVLIDGVKWACEGCIRGHRTSKCSHSDRALTEIKKKGRPVSQCSECRSLRKDKSIHVKCDCAARRAQDRSKPKILANGLADLVKAPSPEPQAVGLAASMGLRVSQLLNPCSCRRGGKCSCLSNSQTDSACPSFLSAPSPSSKGSCCSSNSKEDPLIMSTSASARTVSPSASPLIPIDSNDLRNGAPAALTRSSRPGSGCCGSKAKAAPTSTAPSVGPLFLPTTHGTAACFCGESCACVGCPQHDPLGRKAAEVGIFGSASRAAVECRCSGGSESREGGSDKKPCCGGAMGQLKVAQTEGLGELERIIAKARAGSEGSLEGVTLPPLLWGVGDGMGVGQALPSFGSIRAWDSPSTTEERHLGDDGGEDSNRHATDSALSGPCADRPNASQLSSKRRVPPSPLSTVSPPRSLRRSTRPSSAEPPPSHASVLVLDGTPESGCKDTRDCTSHSAGGQEGNRRDEEAAVPANASECSRSKRRRFSSTQPTLQHLSPTSINSHRSATSSPIDWDSLFPLPKRTSPRPSTSGAAPSPKLDLDFDLKAEDIEELGGIQWPVWPIVGREQSASDEKEDDFAIEMMAAGF